jgi:hypothetical protein
VANRLSSNPKITRDDQNHDDDTDDVEDVHRFSLTRSNAASGKDLPNGANILAAIFLRRDLSQPNMELGNSRWSQSRAAMPGVLEPSGHGVRP